MRDVLIDLFALGVMVAIFIVAIHAISEIGGESRELRETKYEKRRLNRIIDEYEELLCEKEETIASLRARIKQLEREQFDIDNDELK